MRKVLPLLVLMCTLLTSAVGQPGFSDLMAQGDVQGIAALFDDPVELSISKVQGTMHREVAIKYLTNFFSAHTIKSYEEKHTGSSRSNASNYSIGQLVTDKGSYRVFVLYETNSGKLLIREFRIEE